MNKITYLDFGKLNKNLLKIEKLKFELIKYAKQKCMLR